MELGYRSRTTAFLTINLSLKTLENDKCLPAVISLPLGPIAVIQLGKCNCINIQYSSNRCNGRKAKLKCTGLCNFADTGDLCHKHLDDYGDYDPEELNID